MAKSAENASRAMLTPAHRIRCFVREHTLVDRPHASLWLAKTYVISACTRVSVGHRFHAGRQRISQCSANFAPELSETLLGCEANYH
eukprot:665862-Pelagomonas_calceolata.AAC.5